jgi:hypothetical protein
MDPVDHAWWRSLRTIHPEWFTNRRVLEAGSYDINGTVRGYFEGGTYLGVDWRAGPLVDRVCLIHNLPDLDPYETIISSSMLEHDPYWRASLNRLVALLAPGGALLLAWGGALNESHYVETAPDNQFHALPAGKVLALLGSLGCTVLRFQYLTEVHPDGTSQGVCVAAVKGRGVVEHISPLLPEDAA